MSEKFINREYLLDSFKDYNTDIVEKKFDQVNSNLSALDKSKLKGYKVEYDVPANSGGWHKIAQITGGYFNFDLYATGSWSNQRKSNAHFHIQNINGIVRIVQLSGLADPGGITDIRMVRVVDDVDTWILEEYSISSIYGELFRFTIAGDVTVTPLYGSVDTSTDFKDSVSLDVVDVPTGTVITTSNVDNALSSTSENPVQNKVVKAEFDQVKNDLFDVKANMSHNIPRTIPKDITSYYNDGTIWKRLNGTDGFSKYEDIFVGDYFKMSRAISAYNQDQNYQLTGSDWVTIAGISTLLGNGDTGISYEHLVMVPGKGFGGTQHFGRSRMNPTHTTVGGYVGSEMHTTTIGEVVSSGSTATTATINQQLYAEFGSHLKTTRELLSKSLNSTGYNRFGVAGGCSNSCDWYDCQAVLMSEIEVYGSIVWSSSGYDTGTAKMQLPLFANNRQAMNNRSSWYWLKDVASASYFCNCYDNGGAYYLGAGYADVYVRPRFVIAA